MPETLTVRTEATYLARSTSRSLAATGNSAEVASPTLAAAKTGTLTTRTDNDTGTLTMTAGHGITTGQTLDVYWAGGQRRGMTVGTVATNSVPIDGGAGDNLPANTTAITAMVPTSVPFLVTGDAVVGLLVTCPAKAAVRWRTVDPNIIAVATVSDAGAGYSWASGSGVTNPLAGESVATVLVSHGDTQSRTVEVVAVFN
jgi:hypothetical protein